VRRPRCNGRHSPITLVPIGAGAKKIYEDYNKKAQLVVAPAANNLLGGRIISGDREERSPVFRQGVFDFRKSKAYSTDGRLLGTVQKIAKGYV
jgi:metallophosphoesterase superfamily enzyme